MNRGNPRPPGDLRGAPRTATVAVPRPARPSRGSTPEYTFDTFVIGDGNRFPYAAAVAVSEAPAKAYNPLFIYGDSGLGKTHLLHAIGHYTLRLFPDAQVKYVSSEEFTNDFINSIRDDRASAVPAPVPRRRRAARRRHPVPGEQGADAGRVLPHLQHAARALQKQIVISSDRPPKQLSTLEDRLRNRFEWGLITDVTAARPGDPDRDPVEEGGPGEPSGPRGRTSSTSPPTSTATSANSKGR